MPRESLLPKHSDIRPTNIYGYGCQRRTWFDRQTNASALAREMNLSETTLILPREPDLEATDGKGVRIFTTREELPFAEHPTIGTALYLYLYSTAETARQTKGP